MSRWRKLEVYLPEPETDRVMCLQVNYLPGYAPITNRAPEDCDPGAPDEAEILSGVFDDNGQPVPDAVLNAIDADVVVDEIRRGINETHASRE